MVELSAPIKLYNEHSTHTQLALSNILQCVGIGT